MNCPLAFGLKVYVLILLAEFHVSVSGVSHGDIEIYEIVVND